MVDADTNRATFSKQLVLAVKEVGLVKANKDLPAYHTRPHYLGSYPHNLQVQIINTCEARDAAYHFTMYLTGIHAVQQSRDEQNSMFRWMFCV